MTEDSRQSARDLVVKAVEFHGHLGPFLVLGIRMGVIARLALKPQERNDMIAVVSARATPPVSCVIDGVQVASGCTLGKGAIRLVESSSNVSARFRAQGQACTVTVRSEVLNSMLRTLRGATDEAAGQMAEDIMRRSDADLFDVATVP